MDDTLASTSLVLDSAPAELLTSGLGSGTIVAIVLGVLALIGLAVAARRRASLPGPPPAPALEQKPATEPIAREQREAPVAITEGMSLREVKAAKRAVLSDGFKDSEDAEAARQRRQAGKGAVATAAEPEPAPAVEPAPARMPDPAPAPAPATATATATAQEPAPTPEPEAVTAQEPAPTPAPAPTKTLSEGLEKTRGGFFARLGDLFSSSAKLDDALVEELEELLFTADIGVKTSQYLLARVQERLDSDGGSDPQAVYGFLREEMSALLRANHRPLTLDHTPFVVLMVGVNGAGKTTTIGKLAAQFQADGKRVLMVAGDTFRAAAVGQLERWSERVGCGFHRGADEGDPSGVIYDGIARGVAEGYDVVLCDTAGRLQTKTPLMDELRKMGRVSGKALDGAPHATVLVLDANTGQNAIQQAKLFSEAVPVSGVVLTKLDGTAKGGVVLGLSQELGLPIHYIGIGEAVEDLRPFDADEFVDAIF